MTWVARIVQEFEFDAKDANAALAFIKKAQTRTISGAKLTDHGGYVAPKEPKP